MKTFSQLINEDHTIDTTNSLGHPVGLSPKRKKQLLSPYPDFDLINIEDWMGMSFPKNSSHEVKNELKFSFNLSQNNDHQQLYQDEATSHCS